MKALITATIISTTVFATANPAIPEREVHIYLTHEEVDIMIEGNEAVVSGVYNFNIDEGAFFDPSVYLPVYASKDTPAKDIKPTIEIGGEKLKVESLEDAEFVGMMAKHYFGELPRLEGQEVRWFMAGLREVTRSDKKFEMKITYKQKLSNHKFIYTPLIPAMNPNKDYGDIKISADRPIRLLDKDKHKFEEKDNTLTVDPHDKRAIVVEAAIVNRKVP